MPVGERGDPAPWFARDEEYEAPEAPASSPLKFLIKFDADALYLSMRSSVRGESRWSPEELWHQSSALEHFMWHLVAEEGDQKLRHIAVDGHSHLVHSIGHQLDRCRKLEKIHLVFDDRRRC